MPNKIDVYPNGYKGKLKFKDNEYDCVIGKNGAIKDKKEGDWATPIGCFPPRMVYYRGGKVDEPETSLKKRVIKKEDGWCDDESSENYNKHIKLPSEESHETMWRPDDDLYDIVVPLGYNDDSPVPGKGSAIFMHVAREEFTPTAGCIAMKKEDLLEILKSMNEETEVCIHADKSA